MSFFWNLFQAETETKTETKYAVILDDNGYTKFYGLFDTYDKAKEATKSCPYYNYVCFHINEIHTNRIYLKDTGEMSIDGFGTSIETVEYDPIEHYEDDSNNGPSEIFVSDKFKSLLAKDNEAAKFVDETGYKWPTENEAKQLRKLEVRKDKYIENNN